MSLSRQVDTGRNMCVEIQKITNDVKEPLSYVRYFGPKNRAKIGKVDYIDVIVGGERVRIGVDGFFLSAEETLKHTDKLDRARGPALDKEIERLLKERNEWAAKYPHAQFEVPKDKEDSTDPKEPVN